MSTNFKTTAISLALVATSAFGFAPHTTYAADAMPARAETTTNQRNSFIANLPVSRTIVPQPSVPAKEGRKASMNCGVRPPWDARERALPLSPPGA